MRIKIHSQRRRSRRPSAARGRRADARRLAFGRSSSTGPIEIDFARGRSPGEVSVVQRAAARRARPDRRAARRVRERRSRATAATRRAASWARFWFGYPVLTPEQQRAAAVRELVRIGCGPDDVGARVHAEDTRGRAGALRALDPSRDRSRRAGGDQARARLRHLGRRRRRLGARRGSLDERERPCTAPATSALGGGGDASSAQA